MRGTSSSRQRTLGNAVFVLLLSLAGIWLVLRWLAPELPGLVETPTEPDAPVPRRVANVRR